MDIRFSRKFVKQYKKLSSAQQLKFQQRLELWREQPEHELLNHHTLGGKLKDFHSINISGDLRALYKVYGNVIYIYEMIGTHSQLYG